MNARKYFHVPLLAVAMAGLAGCGLPLADEQDTLTNTCESDDQCGSGSVCLEEAGYCVSTTADLSGALIQLDLPSGASYGQGTSHLIDPAAAGVALSGTASNGYIATSFDIEPPQLAEVTTHMAVDLSAFPGCDQAEMEVQLDPVGNPSGIPLTTYNTGADNPLLAVEGGRLLMDAPVLNVPAGMYDIYVRPVPTDEPGGCALPPTILQDHLVEAGQLEVSIDGGEPANVSGLVQGYDVTGWTIDIVENRRGRIISTQHQLDESGAFTLKFWPQGMNEQQLDAVVRLEPPDTASQDGIPSAFYKLDALDIFGTGEVVLDLSELAAAEVVSIDGQVAAASNGKLLPSELVIRSKELLGGALGGTASFKTSVQTDGDGAFTVKLLPGSYDVIAVPADEDYAVTRDELTILSGSDQGGKTIELERKQTLFGTAYAAQGGKAYGIPVLLSPTSPETVSFLENELGDGAAVSIGASAVTGSNANEGQFAVELDPGDYNLTLQPSPESNLPWAVISRLNISAVEGQSVPNLDVTISNPVVLQGRVRDPSGAPIPDALIRVWLAPDNGNADESDNSEPSALQIAETTSDSSGRYELLLPASITATGAN
jgi:hypothetical protein